MCASRMHSYMFTGKTYPNVQTSKIKVQSHVSSTSYATHTLEMLFEIMSRVM